MVKLSFLPKEPKFFILFEQSARNAVKTAQQLREMVQVWQNVSERVSVINDLEHEGDAIAHQILALLNRTFVTPIDREDIALLAHSLDDITDRIHAAADAMLIYRVEHPTNRVKELADILLQTTEEVANAIADMHDHIKPAPLLERCVEVNRLENVGDTVYRSAIAELFAESMDYAYLIKWREIYEHIEIAMDSCEHVANVLEGIALKYA